jgi:hypothetical protein
MAWDEDDLNGQRVERLLTLTSEGDGVLIFDDTGFAKQGQASVGVARQYSGTLGKVGNCQGAVNCPYAERTIAWPVATRLYLPKDWADDTERRKKAKVPEEITFRTKPEIALGLLDQARAWGVRHACVVPTPTTATTPTSWPGWSGAGSGTWWPSAPTSPWRRVARLRRSGRMRGRPACRARPGEPCAGARGARAGCGAGSRRCAAGG